VILVDSNILMYAAGADHAHRGPSLAFLEGVARGEIDAALDAEVLQEILHRYRALSRWHDGRRVYDQARTLFPVIFPVTEAVMDRARVLLDDHACLMARDALHAAVAELHAVTAICSFDRDFDGIPGICRIEPGE
jgi:predicted nucleic acid-binding protein